MNYNANDKNSVSVEQMPESVFTGRIRSIYNESEAVARRMDRVLQNLRGAPPPAPASLGGSAVRQSCIEDYLGQTESMNKNIDDALSEIERLIG